MKKIFTIALAMFAVVGIANAQEEEEEVVEKDFRVITVDGRTTVFYAEFVKDITFVEREDPNVGWHTIGYYLFGEDAITAFLEYDDDSSYYQCEYYVEVQENDNKAGDYRLVDPYAPGIYPWASLFTYETNEEEHWYIEIDASDPSAVAIPYQFMGISHSYYGTLYITDDGTMWGDAFGGRFGSSGSGTLEDGVITFPSEGIGVAAPEYMEKYNYDSYFWGNRHKGFFLDLNDSSDAPGPKNAKK